MKTPYEKGIYQFLSIYRFFTFALAVVLIEALPLQTREAPDLQTYVILSSLGAYTFFKVFAPLRWRQRDRMTYIVLGGDLVICVVLLLYTGGLGSGLLLYSLTPIITAALLFDERITIAVAAISSLSLVAGHFGLSQVTDRLDWVLVSNYLPLLIVYIIVCFLLATMVYRTNLNIRRHIEEDAILEERRRIRREIHDGVAQSLTYLTLKTSQVTDHVSSQQLDKALTGLGEIRSVVQHAYEDIRESIDQLSAEVKTFPLVPTLASYIREFGEKNGVTTRFNAPPALFQLSPVAELQLMRIAQEALTNVRRHAHATEVSMQLANTPQEVQMKVRDNGSGFAFPAAPDSTMKIGGLGIMRERAESLGGTLSIASAPGAGTEISVSLPSDKVRL